MTRVVNINKEPFDIFIGRGRGSKWGNPYTHISDRATLASFIVPTREEAIEAYRGYLLSNKELMDSLFELDGKVLGCFCKPKSCHGDIIIEVLNRLKLLRFLNK